MNFKVHARHQNVPQQFLLAFRHKNPARAMLPQMLSREQTRDRNKTQNQQRGTHL